MIWEEVSTKTVRKTLWPLALLAAVAMVPVLSCSKSETFPSAGYTADPLLTGEPTEFAELNISLAPPSGWAAMDSSNLAQFRLMMTSTGLSQKVFPVLPLAVWADSAIGMMYLAKVGNRVDDLESLAGRFENFLSERKGTGSLTPSKVSLNGLNLYQYLLNTGVTVNYKILGQTSNDGRFLIEYIIRADALEKFKPTIEASLASLKKTGASAPNSQ